MADNSKMKNEILAVLLNADTTGFKVIRERDVNDYASAMVDGAKVGALVGATIGVSKGGKKDTLKALLLGIPIGAGTGALLEEAVYQGYLER